MCSRNEVQRLGRMSTVAANEDGRLAAAELA
jgi:hypothetical protein